MLKQREIENVKRKAAIHYSRLPCAPPKNTYKFCWTIFSLNTVEQTRNP